MSDFDDYPFYLHKNWGKHIDFWKFSSLVKIDTWDNLLSSFHNN